MIDPFTAMAAVSTAVNMIKKAASTVDDVRSLGPLLGKYFDAKHQAVKAVQTAKKDGGSNMAKAIEIELALKQQADFERELQMLFMQTGNIDVWQAIQQRVLEMNRDDALEARKAKEAEQRRARETQEAIEIGLAVAFLVAVLAGVVYGLYWFVTYCTGAGCKL